MESRSTLIPASRNTINLRLHSPRAVEPGNNPSSTAAAVKTSQAKAGQWRKNSLFPRLFHSRRPIAAAPPMLETSAPRCNPCARLVNWSVKNLLIHPLTQQRLCPPTLRGKLHSNHTPGHEYRTAEESRLDYHPGHASDEEMSSGDEEELFSEEKDASTGKLAFGRRKLKLFDQITATDSDAARAGVKSYWREVYKRRFQAKLRHLQTGSSEEDVILYYALEREAGVGDVELPKVKEDSSPLLTAFVIESLTVNRYESLEGMAECYDGLVAAGTALLQHEEQTRSNRSQTGTSETEWKASDPMAVLSTLSPLLITTLEPMSGEAILQLSKLYNLCATARYKRRLVHRIAPHLIRPPNAAMWCLKHHNDMASILTVTEFLFDHAKEIFAPQWSERGKFLKADGRRAHNLRLAALQLKNLNKKENMLHLLSNKSGAQSSGGNSSDVEHGLAEWEILAVDRCIRTSIRNVFDRQWVTPKVAKHPQAPSGRTLHYSSGLSSTSIASTGVGGCPMSPRKIPFSSGTYNSSNNASSTAGVQYMTDSGISLITPGAPGIPPTSTSSTAEIPTPLTPKPHNSVASSTANLISGSPLRNPSSPPKSNRTLPIDTSTSVVINPLPILHTVTNQQSATVRRITQPAVHQTLTKSAEERKRTVAACRALRAQISRFEEAFFQIHHRQPKGAAERAPLATTYAQYREWKRAIRADAATRIQAFFRGARCRSTMSRGSSPSLSKTMKKSSSIKGRGMLKNLSIPGDAVESHAVLANHALAVDGDNKSSQSGYGMEVEERSCISTEGVELIINTAKRRIGLERTRTTNISSPPPVGTSSWHLGRNLRRNEKQKEPNDVAKAHLLSPLSMENVANVSIGNNDSNLRVSYDKKNISLALIHPKKSKYAKIHGSSSNSLDSDDSDNSHSSKGSYSTNSQTASLGDLSLNDLVSQKRELKSQLKTYDLTFAREHGRMPVKAEKEPIRHLYEQYNALKAHISMLEAGGVSKAAQPVVIQQQQPAVLAASTPSNKKQQIHMTAPFFSSSEKSVGSEGSEDSSNRSIVGDRRHKNSNASSSSDAVLLGLGAESSTLNFHLPDDIRALKEEKGNLHQMLRSYEKDFFREHNRQVSSFADIRPVAAQYRRYKEIKKAIAMLQANER